MKRFLPFLAIYASTALGATFLVPSDEVLVRASRAIVIATAGDAHSRYAPGGWIETVLMRLVDVVIAFPFLVLVIAILAIIGPGLTGLYIAVLAVGWSMYARLTRGEMLVLRADPWSADYGMGYEAVADETPVPSGDPLAHFAVVRSVLAQ